ncbi:MAG TPA: hypothetical protein VE913_13315 [Longimicrobium sp.]|nr:hypothetical protein [Longimicrobium sp.]
MPPKKKKDQPGKRVSRKTMLLGAAGLFLFIVGVRRSMRLEEVHGGKEAGKQKGERGKP